MHLGWCHVPHRGTLDWAAANLRLLTFILSPNHQQERFPSENRREWPLTLANPSRGQTRLGLIHPTAFMYSLKYSSFIPVIWAWTRLFAVLNRSEEKPFKNSKNKSRLEKLPFEDEGKTCDGAEAELRRTRAGRGWFHQWWSIPPESQEHPVSSD